MQNKNLAKSFCMFQRKCAFLRDGYYEHGLNNIQIFMSTNLYVMMFSNWTNYESLGNMLGIHKDN